MPRPLTRTARDARHAHREWPRRQGRGNTLVLVTAILVLLVIIASAFLVRSQSGRAQAAAQQKAAGRDDRIDTVASTVAQMVADALFVRPIDPDTYDAQVDANRSSGLQDDAPELGTFMARSDYPRRAPEPQAIRYGIDYFDRVSNLTLAPPASGSPDFFLDGYNFAPYSVNPFTNWPDRYGQVPGEQNPAGNPGFGDARWLASSEPARALINAQRQSGFNTAGLGGGRGNLVLAPSVGAPTSTGSPILSPEGLGFSHWPHLSWIATPENGFRVCWNIADLEGTVPGSQPGVLSGAPGTQLGESALGVPYEQWLPNVAPAEAAVSSVDPRGYLVLNAAEWTARVRNWFNLDSPTSHLETITGRGAGVVDVNPSEARRAFALPNFLQLGAFGSPADEFSVDPTGAPSSRNLIARTLADADGDGWTDSFWFAAPTSSDRSTRQLVAVRIADNSAMINVNVATRFDRSSTAGHTPSDVAMVSRRESYDVDVPGGAAAAARDPGVGFANARENDPEFRLSRRVNDFVEPEPPVAQTANPPAMPTLPPQVGSSVSLVYRLDTGNDPPGMDVGFAPYRWEGGWRPAPRLGTDSQPSLMSLLGVVTEGKLGGAGTGDSTANRLIPIFDTAGDLGFVADPDNPVAVYPGSSRYGDLFALSRPADRLTYFKAMSNNGELIDPISGSRQATLTPFGADDEIELRAANGLNSAFTISRLEMAFNDSQSISSATNENRRPAGQFLRSSRSREESARYLDPTDLRVQDAQVRPANGATLASLGSQGLAPRSGTELLLDHRRHLTTASGARNDLLPPRLWSVVNHSAPPVAAASIAAFQRRGVDFSGGRERDLNGDGVQEPWESAPNGDPDDVTGDGIVDSRDDLPPYHPNVMYPDKPFIGPGAGGAETNPYGVSVRDANDDGRITPTDFELARRRFLDDNRKVDLRRATDEPDPDSGAPASGVDIANAERLFSEDLQRVFRRALLADEGRVRDTTGPAPRFFDRFSSYFGTGVEPREASWGVMSTRLMTASMAANVLSYRDGKRLRGTQPAGGQPPDPVFVDSPLHPFEAIPIPPDHAFADGSLAGAGFVGVEKQPFLMEVFVAFVWPRTSMQLLNGLPDAATCPITFASETADPSDGTFKYELPSVNGGGTGTGIVTYDPDNKATWPAVVFVAQLANPYNEPVKLADFRLVVNSEEGSMPFRFVPPAGGVAPSNPPAVHFHGNTYGPNVELGPCTPEEPRTAIVFSVPFTFPDGRAFPRDAWLDYLDIGARLDEDGNGVIGGPERRFARPADRVVAVSGASVPGGRDPANPGANASANRVFQADDGSLFLPARPNGVSQAAARRGTLLFDATTYPYSSSAVDPVERPYQGIEPLGACGDLGNWTPKDVRTFQSQTPDGYALPQDPGTSFVELQRRVPAPAAPNGVPQPPDAWYVVDRWDNEIDGILDTAEPEPTQVVHNTSMRFDESVRELLASTGDEGNDLGLPPEPGGQCQPVGATSVFRPRGILLKYGADMWITWARSSRQWLFDTDICAQQTPGAPPATDATRAVGDGRIDMAERAPRWVLSRSIGTQRSRRSTPNARLDGTGVSADATGDFARGGVWNPGYSDSFAGTVAFASDPDRIGIPGATPAALNGNRLRPRWPSAPYVNVWGESVNGKVTFLPTRVPEFQYSDGSWYRYYGAVARPAPFSVSIAGFPDWGPAGVSWTSPALAPTVGTPGGDEPSRISWGEKGAAPVVINGFNHLSKFVDGCNAKALTVPLRMFQRDADFESVAEVLDVPIWGPLVQTTGSSAPVRATYATLPEILAQGPNARRWFPMAPSTSQLELLAQQPQLSGSRPNIYGAHPERLNRLVVDPPVRDVQQPDPQSPPLLLAGVQSIPVTYGRADAVAEDAAGNSSPHGRGVHSALPGGLALLDAFVLDDRGASPFDAPQRTITAGGATLSAPDGTIDFAERAAAEDRRFRLARNFEGKLTPGLININTAPVEVLRAMPHMTRLVYDDDFPIAPTAESSPDELDVLDGSELAGETLASRRRAFDPMAPDLGIPQLFAAGAEMAVPATAGTGGFDPFDTGAAGSAVPQIELNDDFGLALGAPASVLPPPASPRVRVAESIDLWRTRGNVDWTPLAGSAPGSVLREPADADMPSYFLRGETTGDPAVNHLLISPGMRATRGFDSLGELALITKGASLGFSVNPAGTVGADADIRDIARRIAPDVNRNGIDDRDPGERALATDPAVANDRWNRVVGWSIAMPGLDPFRASWDAPGAGLGVSSPVQAIRDLGLASGDPLPYWVDGLPALVSTSPPPTAGVQVVTQHLPLSGRTSLDPHLLSIATDDLRTIDNELTTDVVESSEDELRGTPERITRRDLTAGDAIERNQLLRGISNIVTTRSDVFTVWVRVRTIRQDPLTGVWNGTDPEMILDDSRYLMTVDRSSVDRPGEEPRIISFVKVPK